MKNEKLESLLNKVVEYNNPNSVNYKGFLYKNSNGYYIKVVECIADPKESILINNTIILKDGDDQYILHAEKPKLMRVSLKSWHYRLMKYVLRNNAPTSKTMQNGCPYFWLLIFSIFASPFVALWSVIKFIFLLIPEGFLWFIEKSVDAWIMSLDDVEAYEMDKNRYRSSKNGQKLPVTAKIFFDNRDEGFFNYFLSKKYGVGDYATQKEKQDKIFADWTAWRKEVFEARQKRNDEEWALEEVRIKKQAERQVRIAENKKLWEARMKPFNNGMSKLFDSIREAFTFKGDIKSLIKRTKQIVGALVTVILLVATFFIVEGLAYVLILFIDFSIECWYVYAGLGVLAIFVGLIYFIAVFIGGWLQNVVNKYKGGKSVWYIEPLIYLLWYPVKYIGLALGYIFIYIIWKPLEFIIYTFLWKLIIANLAKLIWNGMCSFGRGLANSTGVFGEYFGASYSDYCPGIEWVDEEEQK